MNNKIESKTSPKANFLPTRKQLEREIAHQFQAFNRQKIGTVPKKVSCTIFDNYLVIMVEGAMTPLETALDRNGQADIIERIRLNINQVFKQQLGKIVREVIGVEVEQCICELDRQTEKSIALIVLEQAPAIRVKKRFSTPNKDYQIESAQLEIQEEPRFG